MQDAVLTAYHVMTILFDSGPQTKVLVSDTGSLWIKNIQFGPPQPGQQPSPPVAPFVDAPENEADQS